MAGARFSVSSWISAMWTRIFVRYGEISFETPYCVKRAVRRLRALVDECQREAVDQHLPQALRRFVPLRVPVHRINRYMMPAVQQRRRNRVNRGEPRLCVVCQRRHMRIEIVHARRFAVQPHPCLAPRVLCPHFRVFDLPELHRAKAHAPADDAPFRKGGKSARKSHQCIRARRRSLR